jgi:hypothetical protein
LPYSECYSGFCFRLIRHRSSLEAMA